MNPWVVTWRQAVIIATQVQSLLVLITARQERLCVKNSSLVVVMRRTTSTVVHAARWLDIKLQELRISAWLKYVY